MLNLSYTSSAENWCNMWAVGCHNLWNWRNKETYDVNYVRPHDVGKVVDGRLKEYKNAIEVNKHIMERSLTEILVRWNCPPMDCFKLNVDGSSGQDGRSNCGGCIRNEHGE